MGPVESVVAKRRRLQTWLLLGVRPQLGRWVSPGDSSSTRCGHPAHGMTRTKRIERWFPQGQGLGRAETSPEKGLRLTAPGPKSGSSEQRGSSGGGVLTRTPAGGAHAAFSPPRRHCWTTESAPLQIDAPGFCPGPFLFVLGAPASLWVSPAVGLALAPFPPPGNMLSALTSAASAGGTPCTPLHPAAPRPLSFLKLLEIGPVFAAKHSAHRSVTRARNADDCPCRGHQVPWTSSRAHFVDVRDY